MRMHIESAQHVLDEIKVLKATAERNAQNYRDKVALEDAKVDVLNEVIDQINKLVEFENKQNKKPDEILNCKIKVIDYKNHCSRIKIIIEKQHEKQITYNELFAELTNGNISDFYTVKYWKEHLLFIIDYLVYNNYLVFCIGLEKLKINSPTSNEIQQGKFAWSPNAPAC